MMYPAPSKTSEMLSTSVASWKAESLFCSTSRSLSSVYANGRNRNLRRLKVLESVVSVALVGRSILVFEVIPEACDSKSGAATVCVPASWSGEFERKLALVSAAFVISPCVLSTCALTPLGGSSHARSCTKCARGPAMRLIVWCSETCVSTFLRKR